MPLAGAAREAWQAIRADRRQSLLATVGVVIGVAAIVAALAIGEGARREAVAQVEAIGVDNIIVHRATGAETGLTVDDAAAIRQTADGASAVAALRIRRASVSADDRSVDATVVGATPSWDAVIGARRARGRWLMRSDLDEGRRVAVLGAGLAGRLFDDDPVGQLAKIGADWYRVVGVLAPRSEAGSSPGAVSHVDVQDSAIVPLNALDVRGGPNDAADAVDEIAVRARSADRVAQVASSVRSILRQRGLAGAELLVPRELIAARTRARRTFDAVLLAIGVLVLATSGVGIMNVMLTGIARRTVEIGIRRAVGARRADIVSQFVVESALLSVAGGAAGLPVGIAASAGVSALAGWATAVSVSSMAIAMLVAAATGLLFGAYPARVAAGWTPCEALRHE